MEHLGRLITKIYANLKPFCIFLPLGVQLLKSRPIEGYSLFQPPGVQLCPNQSKAIQFSSHLGEAIQFSSILGHICENLGQPRDIQIFGHLWGYWIKYMPIEGDSIFLATWGPIGENLGQWRGMQFFTYWWKSGSRDGYFTIYWPLGGLLAKIWVMWGRLCNLLTTWQPILGKGFLFLCPQVLSCTQFFPAH
jgi:hypothetical protein